MEVFGTNVFNTEKIDWKTWVQALLWYQVVSHKNEFSGHELMIEPWEGRPQYKKGDIIGDTRLLSYYIGKTRPLTWKELALAMGFWKDYLLPDHHDCSICSQRKKCTAYFKDDKDQERCSGWMDEHGCPDVEEEYKKFIDNLMNPTEPFTPVLLSEEELKELSEELAKSIKEAYKE